MLRRLYYNFVTLKQRERWYHRVCLSMHISCLMLTGPILENEGKGTKFSKNGIKTHKQAWQEKNEGKLTKYSDMSCIFLSSHSKMVQIGPWFNLFSVFIVSNSLILFRFIVFILFNTRLTLPFCNLRALLSANKLCTMVFRCILLEGTSKAIVFFYLCLNHFFSGLRVQLLVSPA